MSNTISICVAMDDKEKLKEAGHMLLLLAGSGAAVVSEYKQGVSDIVQGIEQEPVNTAAVFAQAPPAPPVPTPPPAPVAAPSAPPAPPVPGAGPELDKQGLPWDARINTKNHEKTQKGIYKTTKGLPDGYYDQIVAELRQTYPLQGTVPTPPAATASAVQTTTVPPPPSASPAGVASPGIPTPPAASATPVPPTPPTPPTPPISDTPAGYILTAAAQGQTYTQLLALGWTQETLLSQGIMQQSVPPTPPAPPAPAEPVPSNFGELMGHVTKMMPAGKIRVEEINAVCVQHGLTQLSDVATRPDLIPDIYEGCRAIWSVR